MVLKNNSNLFITLLLSIGIAAPSALSAASASTKQRKAVRKNWILACFCCNTNVGRLNRSANNESADQQDDKVALSPQSPKTPHLPNQIDSPETADKKIARIEFTRWSNYSQKNAQHRDAGIPTPLPEIVHSFRLPPQGAVFERNQFNALSDRKNSHQLGSDQIVPLAGVLPPVIRIKRQFEHTPVVQLSPSDNDEAINCPTNSLAICLAKLQKAADEKKAKEAREEENDQQILRIDVVERRQSMTA